MYDLQLMLEQGQLKREMSAMSKKNSQKKVPISALVDAEMKDDLTKIAKAEATTEATIIRQAIQVKINSFNAKSK